MTSRACSLLVLLLIVALLSAAGMSMAGEASHSEKTICPASGDQSEKCGPDQTASECTCGDPGRDAKCACAVALEQGTGTITGKLKNPFLRRRPAVVYVEKVTGRQFVLPAENPIMDQKNLMFTPSLLPVLVGSTVDFPNSDTVRHNVFSPAKSPKPFNLGTYPAGEVKQLTFDKEGVVPLLCNVHAEMSAYIVVLQNPYFTLTDEAGGFTIRNVPEGEYILTFWHEDLKSVASPIKITREQLSEVQFENVSRK